ncbi:MAG: proprotein convertase P-domain-containing protein [Acidobacteriota bacterium]
MSQSTYTYRSGQRLELTKSPDEYVIRALPDALVAEGLPTGEVVSSTSTRVGCNAVDLDTSMDRGRELAVTHHSYHLADDGGEFLITDRVLLRLTEASDDALTELMNRHALHLLTSYDDRTFLFRLTNQTGRNPIKLVVELTENDDRVECVEHDLNMRATPDQLELPDDERYLDQWHLHRRSTSDELDPRSSSRCEAAWQLLDGTGSPEVVIAVTDSGCRLDHRDFDGPGKFADWGYLRGTRLVTSSDVDAEPNEMYLGINHGTSCAGVAAGEMDGVLTVGAAPGCRLLPIQWEIAGGRFLYSDSKLLTVMEHVSARADVVTNSWSTAPQMLLSSITRQRLEEMTRTGGRRGTGLVFVWSAGNRNAPIHHEADVDVPFTTGWQGNRWVGVATSRTFRNELTEIDGMIHVAALSSEARRSHYSSYGTGVDVCAPSANGHAYRRLRFPGLFIITATGSDDEVTEFFGGTSAAAPLVAGVVALIISANPRLSAAEVSSILRSTASKDLDPTDWPRTPSASYDQDTSWDVSPIAPFDDGAFVDQGHPDGTWSPWFGHGNVDAEAAVAEALQRGESDSAVVSASAQPRRDIPDFQRGGIVERLRIDEPGRIESLKIELDVTHTWIGDLRVELESPEGRRAVLHDRAGASRDDLALRLEMDRDAALGVFRDAEVRGDWLLRVEDLARLDTGRLESWSIEAGVAQGGGLVTVVNEESVRIPDASVQGIASTLEVGSSGPIQSLDVGVDITHPWIGDLTIVLRSPAGSEVVLRNREGGSDDNPLTTWRSTDLADLRRLVGEDGAGTWTLEVADRARRDVGKLNTWSLTLLLG